MSGLAATAPGKVNLALVLGPTREDGRHELVTVLESLSLADRLKLTVRASGSADSVTCPGVEGPNLAGEAIARLREAGWEGPPVAIEIEKRVPVAGGMGGGSADAAAALRLAAALAPVDAALLQEVAAGLGADVPSQLRPGVWLGTGAGERLDPLPELAEHAVVILPLPLALSTPAVYREADRLGLPRAAGELAAWRERLLRHPGALLVNDLQPATISLCPPVAGALDAARRAGAEQALVCGSGPTVAGVFWGAGSLARAEQAAGALRERYPGAVAARPVGPQEGEPTGL